MKILIAEDKMDIANLVKIFLEKEGYEIIIFNNGKDALDYLLENEVSLCIFDIMMPEMDGFTLIQKVREFSNIPIIVLSAKDLEQDKILGLDLGADDYITKPFSSLELVSRVNAHIRRVYKMDNKEDNFIKYGDLLVDKDKFAVYKNDIELGLTAMEYKLFLKLISSPGRVFTKSQLYESTTENYIDSDENTIAVHISRLRDKIEDDPKNPKYIKTIRGLGYKIEKE